MPETPNAGAGREWGVSTQSFKDHVVLRPPNRLKDLATRKVGLRDKSEAEAITRAEHALELLSVEFDSWMHDEIETLEAARQAASEGDVTTLDALYRSSHDIRGQAATFGFPLAGEIADGLCTLLERMGHRSPPQALVDRHVEAIRAIVRENVRSRDHALGVAIVQRLAELRNQIAPPLAGG
jgi:chemotaxis protein histidine kinase CheA